ncbi:MAG: InlB B-repeat-containing protein [Lachnospiraceae bacterium]|nr:InlB B-repeat-containing protein [Lachnospiraceae bacterium]
MRKLKRAFCIALSILMVFATVDLSALQVNAKESDEISTETEISDGNSESEESSGQEENSDSEETSRQEEISEEEVVSEQEEVSETEESSEATKPSLEETTKEGETEGEVTPTYEKIKVYGTERTVDGVMDLTNNVVTIPSTQKTAGFYEIRGLEPGKAYTIDVIATNSQGWTTSFPDITKKGLRTIFGGTVVTDASGNASLSTSSRAIYAIVKEGESYYAELKEYPYSTATYAYDMIYTLKEVPSIQSVTFPFDKLTLYKNITPNGDLVNSVLNAKISKQGITVTFADGSTKRIYSLDELCVTQSSFCPATYNAETGEWVRTATSNYIPNNGLNDQRITTGTYLMDFYTPDKPNGTEGAFVLPVEFLDPADIPYVYSEEGEEIISKEVALENYKQKGDYTYFAIDIKSGKEYYFDTNNFFYYTIRNTKGEYVKDTSDSYISTRHSSKSFKISTPGTYYVIAWDLNYTNTTCKLSSLVSSSPALNVGDSFYINGEILKLKGKLREGDVITYTGEETEVYELVDLKTTKGYSVLSYSDYDKEFFYGGTTIYEGTLVQTSDQISFKRNRYMSHYYPESGYRYFIILTSGQSEATDYKIYGHKKPKSLDCGFSITTYEGMRADAYNEISHTYFCNYLKRRGAKVTYVDGTTDIIYNMNMIGVSSYNLVDSTGRIVTEGPAPVKGEYTMKFTEPVEFSVDYTVKSKDEMPLLYSKDEEGNVIRNILTLKDYKNTGERTYFKADLEKDKTYKIDLIGSKDPQRYAYYTVILDKDNNFVTEPGTALYLCANTIQVEESGTYYFLAYNNVSLGDVQIRMREVNTSELTAFETATEYNYQNIIYKNLYFTPDYNVKEVLKPVFKYTYKDEEVEYVPYESGSTRILYYNLYLGDMETTVSSEVNELEPGEYYAQFRDIDTWSGCYAPITVKDPSELTDRINPGDTVHLNAYAVPDGYIPFAMSYYKAHLNNGMLYRFEANENVEMILLDEEFNVLGNETEVLSYAPVKDMEAYVVFINTGGEATATLTESKQISGAKIISQPFRSTYYSEFDSISLEGLVIQISYKDGSKDMVYPSNLSEFGRVVKGFEGVKQITGRDGSTSVRCIPGTYHFEFEIYGYNKTVTGRTFTVKNAPVKNLAVGETVSVAAGAQTISYETLKDGVVNKVSVNGAPGVVYKAKLTKGDTYFYDVSLEGSFAIYEDTGKMLYPSNDFSEMGEFTGNAFIPAYSGDYYFRISPRQATQFLLFAAESPASVEIFNQPFGNKINPYYVGLSDIAPWGLSLKLTFIDGSEEVIEYGDENWNTYVKDIVFYQDDENVEKPDKDGSYQCEVLLNAKDTSGNYMSVMTNTFTQKWGIWTELGNVLNPDCVITDAEPFRGYTYVKLNVVPGNTYVVRSQGADDEISIGYIQNHIKYDYLNGQTLSFTAEAGREYVAYYQTQAGVSRTLELISVKKVTDVSLNSASPVSLTYSYANPVIPAGIMLDLSYKGTTEVSTILLQKDGAVYAESGLAYTPGVNISILSNDGVSPAVKDSKGFYPANPSGKNYYFKIQVKEPVESGVRDYVLVPFVVKGAESNYTVSFDNNENKLKAYFPDVTILGSMAVQTMKKDVQTALAANKFTAKGYTLMGWTTDATMDVLCASNLSASELKNANPYRFYLPGEKVNNLSTNGEEVKLYAIWKEDVYRINYHTNGAEFVDANAIKQSYTVNSPAVALPAVLNNEGVLNEEVIKADSVIGYEFDGWYKDAEFKTPAAGIQEGSVGDVDFYAKWTPLPYTLVFHGNGGSASKIDYEQTVDFGVPAKAIANAYQMTDFAFMGWSIKATALADVNALNYESFIVCADKGEFVINRENVVSYDEDGDRVVHLYAVWTNNFLIQYDFDGDYITGDVYYGEGVDERGEILLSEGTHPTSYTYGQVIKFDAKPVRVGYTFGGWYKDPFYKNKITGITAKTFGNQKIYAKWTPNPYTIAFKSNGGSGKMASVKTTCFDGFAPEELQKKVVIPECAYTKKGYKFKEWSAVINGATVTFMPGDEVSNLITLKGKTVNLNAVWELDTYTVTLNTRGGVIDSTQNFTEVEANNRYSANYQFNTKISTVTLPIASMEGYEFGGWFTDKTYKKQVKDMRNLAGDIELYAKWSAPFTVSFDANGGTGVMADIIGNTGNKITLTNKFTNPGYAFVGWSVIKPGSSEWDAAMQTAIAEGKSGYQGVVTYENKHVLICPDANTVITGAEGKNLTLYAVWAKDFKITFNPCCLGASNVDTVDGKVIDSYSFGDTISVLPKPIKTGYIFTGWYLDKACKKKVTKITNKDFGDKVLYAGWKNAAYNITFVANAPFGTKVSGNTGKQKLTFNVCQKLKKNSFKINGYTFKGWATTPTGEVKYTDMQMVFKMSGPFKVQNTLYAVWEKNYYDISYDFNNGEKLEHTSQDVKDLFFKTSVSGAQYRVRYVVGTQMNVNSIAVPERIGYTFAGWYLDPACKKKFSGIKANGTGNYTLYAKWKPVKRK